jgi:hypothetical protein
MELNKNELLYIKLRAECIQRFHVVHNSHNYHCTWEHALKVARIQFEHEKRGNSFLIKIDELLTLTLDQCNDIIKDNKILLMTSKLKV